MSAPDRLAAGPAAAKPPAARPGRLEARVPHQIAAAEL
ncbi:MAG: hypothetical protein JWQ97_2366 [Phenylobacterium sp.]|nr:hypothetical protein [Phenylobacterium sp.]